MQVIDVNGAAPNLIGMCTMDSFWMNFVTQNLEVVLINIQTKVKVLSIKINNGHANRPSFAQPWVDLGGNSYVVYTNSNANLSMIKVSQSGTVSWSVTFGNVANTFGHHCTYYSSRSFFYLMSITKLGGTNNNFNLIILNNSGVLQDFQILSTTNTPSSFEIDYISRMRYLNELDHTAGCVKLATPNFSNSEFGVFYYAEGSKYFKPKEINLTKFSST